MTAQGQTRTFFAADQNPVVANIFTDELESNGSFQYGKSMMPGNSIDEMRGGHRTGHIPSYFSGTNQIIEKQSQYIVRFDKGPVDIEDSITVRIAIGDQPQGNFNIPSNKGHKITDADRGRLRRQATEIRVAVVVDDDHLDPGLAQQHIKVATPGAIQGIDRDGHARAGDGLKIDQTADTFEIGVAGIDLLNQSRPKCLVKRNFLITDFAEHCIGAKLDIPGYFRQCGPAPVRREFKSIVFIRVVTGGKVDSSSRLAPENFKSDDRRRRITVAQKRFDTGTGQDSGRFPGKSDAHEPGVVADDHPAIVNARDPQMIGNGLGNNPHIVEDEIFTKNAAPTRRSETDSAHRSLPSNRNHEHITQKQRFSKAGRH